jgi:hypothetical protein
LISRILVGTRGARPASRLSLPSDSAEAEADWDFGGVAAPLDLAEMSAVFPNINAIDFFRGARHFLNSWLKKL